MGFGAVAAVATPSSVSALQMAANEANVGFHAVAALGTPGVEFIDVRATSQCSAELALCRLEKPSTSDKVCWKEAQKQVINSELKSTGDTLLPADEDAPMEDFIIGCSCKTHYDSV